MKPRIDFITLAVGNLEKSVAFYKDVLGFPTQGTQEGFEDHVLFELENGFGLVLYERIEFLTFTSNPNQKEPSSGFILSHFAEDKEEVDAILAKALKGGATQIGEVSNEAWGYSVNFADPDGHQWEINWSPAHRE